MKMINGLLVAAAMFGAMASGAASAATLVDTGEQPTGTDNGTSLAAQQNLAGQFTLSAAAVLTDIQGFIVSFDAQTVTVNLHDNAGVVPGSVLFSADFLGDANGIGGVWQGISGVNWAVDAGTYWVSFAPTDSLGYTPSTMPNPLSAYAFNFGQGSTWIPTTSDNGFGLRVFGDAVAVPEPATWGTLIIGFGMMGAAMRVRRRRASVVSA